MADEAEQSHLTVATALDQLDLHFWTKQSPLLLDIVGEYAGQEHFLVDGDALLQYVLDDALLALGRDRDPSYQVLHALWLLEQTVDKLIKRDCTFSLVFFASQLHGTVHTGASDHVTQARTLARQVLRRQLNETDLVILDFLGLDDPEWVLYYEKKRPIFMMSFDGGLRTKDGDALQAERILLARVTLFTVMTQGTAVVLLQTADFKDGKIISYVYDGTLKLRTDPIPADLVEMSDEALETLNALASSTTAGLLAGADALVAPESPSMAHIVATASKLFLSLDSTKASPLDSTLLFLYLAHLLLIQHLSLAARAQCLPAFSEALGSYLEASFLPPLYASLAATVGTLDVTQEMDDFDVDGRIFLILATEVAGGATNLEDLLGPQIYAAAQDQWTALGQAPVDLSLLQKSFPQDGVAPVAPIDDESPLTLLPFSNDVFDSHFTSVHIAVSDAKTVASTPNRLDADTVFSDTTYWQNPKPVLPTHQGGAPPPVLDARQRKKRDRKEQRYMAQMQKNAASLTGALGRTLTAQAIPAVGNRAKVKVVAANGKAAVVRAQPKKEAVKVLTSTEKLLAANEAKKVAEDAVLNGLWWADKLAELKPLPIPAQIVLLTSFLRNKRAKDRWLGTEIVIKRLDLEARKWIADESRELPSTRDAYTTFLARTAHDLLQQAVKGDVIINEKQGKAILAVLDALGLSCLVPAGMVFGAAADAAALAAAQPVKKGNKKDKDKKGAEKDKKGSKDDKEESTGAKLTFSFVSLTKSGKPVYDYMKITEDPIEFQLRCMGEYMVRSLGSLPDPRVSFEPDAWQREVLDKIDRDESMLIVAPTSAGKTFISFHAMERVLRDSDDGIVIYVAPTKALVNQVAAEVFARFRKEVPGKAMWAIHTRDYRINNPHNCQILVTVPHVLSMMLLSPALAAVWTPRIRRVILDEIHSISDDEGGAIWEQVLLLNPAPLIGLSATVGAPERFSDWLASIEATRGRKYSLIQHHHRFNALRKFAYAPVLPVRPVKPLTDHKETPGVFAHVHPIAALALGDATLPSDLALEPVDCLSLFKAMNEADPEHMDASLVPSTYFADTPSIKIADVLPYEQKLKNVLVEWMKESRVPGSAFHKTVDALESPLRNALKGPEEAIANGGDELFYSLFTPMLADLQPKGLLPCIIFNFDRGACEKIGQRILADLEAGEDRWRRNSPEWKRRVAKAEADEKLAKVRAKAMERSQKKEDEDGRVVDQDDGATAFDPDAPSEEFSFCGKGISQVEFAKELDELSWLQLPAWIINALRRGVGVHHSGMNRRYRTLVENLYRRGILRVVVATGTLSIGINAPARTCIFGGDSVFLTALNFRQCAGRAGRRGFDTLGNVLFVGVSLHRIERLLVSRLPKLGGSFPMTTTLILRIHNLLHGSDNAPIAVKAIQNLLTLPQLSVGSTADREQVLHFLRFSIEYCRRAGLLDEAGRPMNLFGLAQALYPYEPSNFALIALFRSGELHKITKDIDKDVEETCQQLLVVLAHLFGRQQRRAQSPESLQSIVRNSPSKVILPPLPPSVVATLQRHHDTIVSIFSVYAKEYSQQNSKHLGQDSTLPISGRKVAPDASTDESAFASKLAQASIPVDSRSPFVALSGHADKYASITELADTARAGLVLTKHAVPSLLFLTSPDHELDAYVVDFYKHGSLAALVRDNGIRKSEVWFWLQDFSVALLAIKSALEALLQRSSEEREEDNDSDDGRNAPAGGGGADDVEGSTANDEILRPANVNEGDWRLYRTVCAIAKEFNTKFYKVFA